jgi:hypothetical protein
LSLIAFHRVLIATGILFCFGFAAWELALWWVTRQGGALAMGIVFIVLAIGLCVYLARLRQFLGYDKDEPRS